MTWLMRKGKQIDKQLALLRYFGTVQNTLVNLLWYSLKNQQTNLSNYLNWKCIIKSQLKSVVSVRVSMNSDDLRRCAAYSDRDSLCLVVVIIINIIISCTTRLTAFTANNITTLPHLSYHHHSVLCSIVCTSAKKT